MKGILFLLTLLITQSNSLPDWFTKSFRENKLDGKYQISGFLKTSFLEADFNGDGVKDIAALVVEKKTLKKGILLIHGETNQYFLFGAGTQLGKIGFDAHDDLKWLRGWKVNKDKFTYETVFDNGDIVGSKKIRLLHPGLSLWDLLDGAPNAGGTIYWNGTKYIWIHEGE